MGDARRNVCEIRPKKTAIKPAIKTVSKKVDKIDKVDDVPNDVPNDAPIIVTESGQDYTVDVSEPIAICGTEDKNEVMVKTDSKEDSKKGSVDKSVKKTAKKNTVKKTKKQTKPNTDQIDKIDKVNVELETEKES